MEPVKLVEWPARGRKKEKDNKKILLLRWKQPNGVKVIFLLLAAATAAPVKRLIE